MTKIGEKERLELMIHPSIFTIPSLAFLKTNTEAYVVEAGTGGGSGCA